MIGRPSPEDQKKKKPNRDTLDKKLGLGEGPLEAPGQIPAPPPGGGAGGPPVQDPNYNNKMAQGLLPPGVAAMSQGQASDVNDDMSRRFKHRQSQQGAGNG
jgi:hypothetical protein